MIRSVENALKNALTQNLFALADNNGRLCISKLLPFNDYSFAYGFVLVSSDRMALMVDVFVDRGMNGGPNLFHQYRAVSCRISMPHSCRRSSTFRSDSGNRTYILTARRMISGEVLK